MKHDTIDSSETAYLPSLIKYVYLARILELNRIVIDWDSMPMLSDITDEDCRLTRMDFMLKTLSSVVSANPRYDNDEESLKELKVLLGPDFLVYVTDTQPIHWSLCLQCYLRNLAVEESDFVSNASLWHEGRMSNQLLLDSLGQRLLKQCKSDADIERSLTDLFYDSLS